jgi:hypothetical protein
MSTKVLQNFFVFQKQNVTIQKFKLEILICFNSFITNHWTPLHQMPHTFTINLKFEYENQLLSCLWE